MINISVANKVLLDNYNFIQSLSAYFNMTRNIEIVVVRGDKTALKEEIEAEVKGKNILIYEDVFEKMYGENNLQSIAQTISHEFWHIFSARFKFYSKLEKIYLGEIPKINKLDKNIIIKFLDFLNNLNEEEVKEIINKLREKISCWTDDYIESQAWYDRKKKFINRIDNFYLSGVLEEMFAESYAELVTQIKENTTPKYFSIILKKLFLKGG